MSETEPSDKLFVAKSEELLNLTKLNLARLNNLQTKALSNIEGATLMPEALDVGKALASTVSDQLWISAMISEGLPQEFILRIWNTKDHESSDLRQNIQKKLDIDQTDNS